MKSNRIPLDEKREVYAYGQILGIGPDLEPYTGYDDHLLGSGISDRSTGDLLFDEDSDLQPLTLDDKLYLCEIAISRWEKYREMLLKLKEDTT